MDFHPHRHRLHWALVEERLALAKRRKLLQSKVVVGLADSAEAQATAAAQLLNQLNQLNLDPLPKPLLRKRSHPKIPWSRLW